MITVNKVSGHNNIRRTELMGLSTDTKPDDASNGDMFNEIDTGIIFLFDKENNKWIPQV